MITALKSNPLFSHSELYLYEKDKVHPIKIVSQKIGTKGLVIVGSYELVNENEVFGFVDNICTAIDGNEKLFEKRDMLLWSSSVVEKNSELNIPSKKLTEYDSSLSHCSFDEIFQKANT